MEIKKKMSKIEKRHYIINKVKNEIHHLKKDDLIWICERYLEEKIKRSYTKDDLLGIIHKRCKRKQSLYIKIYDLYKYDNFGMNIWETCEMLQINSYKRKELQKYYILRVAYTYETRAYKQYMDVPVFDTECVLDLLGQDLDALLKDARKQARKN